LNDPLGVGERQTRRSSTPLTTEKMATFAPIPSANVMRIVAVNGRRATKVAERVRQILPEVRQHLTISCGMGLLEKSGLAGERGNALAYSVRHNVVA
jgi:hypothetical protein